MSRPPAVRVPKPEAARADTSARVARRLSPSDHDRTTGTDGPTCPLRGAHVAGRCPKGRERPDCVVGTANLRSTARDQSVRSICGQEIIPYLEWPAARFQIWDPPKPMSISRTGHTFVFKWAVFILFLTSRLNFLWPVFSGPFSWAVFIFFLASIFSFEKLNISGTWG